MIATAVDVGPLVDEHDRPHQPVGLYSDRVGYHVACYNPDGYGGVTVLDATSARLLALCDGTRTVNELAGLDGRDLETVRSEVTTLVEREVLVASRTTTLRLHERAARPPRLSCWLHLTNRCNLACTYCYVRRAQGDTTLQQAAAMVDRLLASCRTNGIGRLDVKLAGGEPLLRSALLTDLLSHTRAVRGDVHVSFTLLTNGVLVTPRIADLLAQHRVGVGVSLDGLGPVHDLARVDLAGRGTFDRVIRGLDNLVAAGVHPTVMTTVSRATFPHLVDLTLFLLERRLRFRFSLERDSVASRTGLMGHERELIDVLHRCYDVVEAHLPRTDFLKLHTFGDAQLRRPARRACGAGSNFFAIGTDGQLGLCGMGLDHPFSAVRDAGPDLLAHVRARNADLHGASASSYPDCVRCVWRASCAGACPLQTKATYGIYEHRSPYCNVYRAALPRVVRIRALQMIAGPRGSGPATDLNSTMAGEEV